jgi:hypothetical protein
MALDVMDDPHDPYGLLMGVFIASDEDEEDTLFLPSR